MPMHNIISKEIIAFTSDNSASSFVIPELYFYDNGGAMAAGYFDINTEKYSTLKIRAVTMKNSQNHDWVGISISANGSTLLSLRPGATQTECSWSNKVIDVSNFDSIRFNYDVFGAYIRVYDFELR